MEDTGTDTQMPGKEWGLHGGQAASSLHRASLPGPALGRYPALGTQSPQDAETQSGHLLSTPATA